MPPIREYRIDVSKEWREAIKRCKVNEFLRDEFGKEIVSDFYSDLKAQNGTQFSTAFEFATRTLLKRVLAYWLRKISAGIKVESYQKLAGRLECLTKQFSTKESIAIITTCIFWILHDQSDE